MCLNLALGDCLFSLRISRVDAAHKTCQLGDTLCVPSKSRPRSRELRQKRHMILEIFSCNFAKSPPYLNAMTPFGRGVLQAVNASASAKSIRSDFFAASKGRTTLTSSRVVRLDIPLMCTMLPFPSSAIRFSSASSLGVQRAHTQIRCHPSDSDTACTCEMKLFRLFVIISREISVRSTL